MSKKLRAWQCVRNAASIRNMPPYTYIYRDDKNPPHIEQFICPDVDAAQDAARDGELLVVDDLNDAENYRGLVLEINDHGNATLYRSFRNGNLREIWSIV